MTGTTGTEQKGMDCGLCKSVGISCWECLENDEAAFQEMMEGHYARQAEFFERIPHFWGDVEEDFTLIAHHRESYLSGDSGELDEPNGW